MFQVREERIERTMEAMGFDRMGAINFERSRDAVNENFRRGKHPSWFGKPSWALEG